MRVGDLLPEVEIRTAFGETVEIGAYLEFAPSGTRRPTEGAASGVPKSQEPRSGESAPMQNIDLDGLQRLIAEDGTQLVEVLPLSEYEEEHLPGAIGIPLEKLADEAHERLDPSRPVVVYCYDYQ